MDRRILFILIMSLAVPYGCSMALLGTSLAKPGGLKEQEALSAAWASDSREKRSFRRIRMDMEDPPEKTVDLETYLPIVVAGQISAESHPEAIKAQTILARTYICRQMEQMGLEEEIPESSLGLEKNRNNQMEPLWGTEIFPEYYSRFEKAARETEGVTLTWEGHFIDPLFTHTTTGFTRPGDEEHPYLASVSCVHDPEEEGFVQEMIMRPEEAAKRVSAIPAGDGSFRTIPPEAFPEQVQIISRDEAGYALQLQIGGFPFNGEEVRLALGLPSACFELDRHGSDVRFTVRGRGHGWGLSQTEAQALAEDGWSAEAILEYFYTGISFSSE